MNRTRLRVALAAFFLALAIPTAVLVSHAYGQLEWEAFHRHQAQAEELASRIDEQIGRLIRSEERRSFADYGFLVVLGDPSANYVQRSALSSFPVESPLPGLIGHFQVDVEGRLSTPLLPEIPARAREFGIGDAERADRQALESRIERVLVENRLVGPSEPAPRASSAPADFADAEPSVGPAAAPIAGALHERKDASPLASAPAPAAAKADAPAMVGESVASEVVTAGKVSAQSAFDQLVSAPERRTRTQADEDAELARVEDLALDRPYETEADVVTQRLVAPRQKIELGKRLARKERGAVPLDDRAAVRESEDEAPRITTFESELDPFEFARLGDGHLVLYRKVWRDGRRYIQGLLIDQRRLLEGLVENVFRSSALSGMSDLIVAGSGDVLSTFRAGAARSRYPPETAALAGALLYSTRLSAPLGDLELIFTITRLPIGPGGRVVNWLAAVLAFVLCGGCWVMYRLGLRQIALTRQQQDFVSAVSHELKTPLTSIRMYGEMLREGWASEEKRREYYAYICDESERLTRLIANVLQLARMTRNDLEPDLRPVPVSELIDSARSKADSQVQQAGFELDIRCDEAVRDTTLLVDTDFFSQIAINLVDNAIKFSARAERKAIEVSCVREPGGTVRMGVRDYGPGVPRDQMKKIFGLFYRSDSGLSRETVGTGIGLSLVHQLAKAMGARVDVINVDPGAEFQVHFPIHAGDTPRGVGS